jgi:bifunctional non-homologous end joining protein LigD
MRALAFRRIMLDGEAVAHCPEGLPNFHKLLGDGQASACFYAFDLLWLEAQDVRGVELIGRRRMLQKSLKKAGPALRFSGHMAGAEAMFRHACATGSRSSSQRRRAIARRRKVVSPCVLNHEPHGHQDPQKRASFEQALPV